MVRQSLGDLLFDLCVNFLLYCALIIVFYMLVRFYLEEEATEEQYNLGYMKLSNDDEKQYSDGINKDNEKNEYNDDDQDKNADDEGEKKEVNLLDIENNEKEIDQKTENIFVKEKLIKMEIGTSSSSSSETHHYNTQLLSAPRNHESKTETMKNLAICAVGLNVCFVIWGLVQERILTQPYNGDFFEYSYGLVFLNRLGGLILSSYLMYYFKVSWVYSPVWEFSFPSVANMLSSWCQYEALKYVSFPTQMLAKAFKILPTMLMGKYLYDKTYETDEYSVAGMIGFGLFLFIASSEKISFSQGIESSLNSTVGSSGPVCGVVLLLLFLFFDSFTGQFQTRMFQLHKNMSPIQMMFLMNGFSTVFAFITLIHQEELYVSLTFVFHHHTILTHLIIFCLCSTIGQLFIFYTVKKFGPVVFSIIMSCRILFSTLLSCFVYIHPITELGFIGIIIVFSAIAFRTNRQMEIKPILLWRENNKEEENEGVKKDFLHELHEHLDI